MRPLSTKTNVETPDSTYPYSRVKNNTGSNNGTPVNEALLGDYIQFFERLMNQAGITPNNLPDNAYSGFQIFEALQKYINIYPYKSYVANITQSGTSNPTVVVMPGNEIGTIVWTRVTAGQYAGTLSGAFTDSTKVTCVISGIYAGTALIGRTGANTVEIITANNSGVAADGGLSGTHIEIRVYQ